MIVYDIYAYVLTYWRQFSKCFNSVLFSNCTFLLFPTSLRLSWSCLRSNSCTILQSFVWSHEACGLFIDISQNNVTFNPGPKQRKDIQEIHSEVLNKACFPISLRSAVPPQTCCKNQIHFLLIFPRCLLRSASCLFVHNALDSIQCSAFFVDLDCNFCCLYPLSPMWKFWNLGCPDLDVGRQCVLDACYCWVLP